MNTLPGADGFNNFKFAAEIDESVPMEFTSGELSLAEQLALLGLDSTVDGVAQDTICETPFSSCYLVSNGNGNLEAQEASETPGPTSSHLSTISEDATSKMSLDDDTKKLDEGILNDDAAGSAIIALENKDNLEIFLSSEKEIQSDSEEVKHLEKNYQSREETKHSFDQFSQMEKKETQSIKAEKNSIEEIDKSIEKDTRAIEKLDESLVADVQVDKFLKIDSEIIENKNQTINSIEKIKEPVKHKISNFFLVRYNENGKHEMVNADKLNARSIEKGMDDVDAFFASILNGELLVPKDSKFEEHSTQVFDGKEFKVRYMTKEQEAEFRDFIKNYIILLKAKEQEAIKKQEEKRSSETSHTPNNALQDQPLQKKVKHVVAPITSLVINFRNRISTSRKNYLEYLAEADKSDIKKSIILKERIKNDELSRENVNTSIETQTKSLEEHKFVMRQPLNRAR